METSSLSERVTRPDGSVLDACPKSSKGDTLVDETCDNDGVTAERPVLIHATIFGFLKEKACAV